jgi:hypothetical protein
MIAFVCSMASWLLRTVVSVCASCHTMHCSTAKQSEMLWSAAYRCVGICSRVANN